LDTELPVIRDDKLVSGYIRMEQKRGLIGIYEKENPIPSGMITARGIMKTGCLMPITTASCPGLKKALNRMPIFAELGISAKCTARLAIRQMATL
jgi:dimethylglycine dehydrogenase